MNHEELIAEIIRLYGEPFGPRAIAALRKQKIEILEQMVGALMIAEERGKRFLEEHPEKVTEHMARMDVIHDAVDDIMQRWKDAAKGIST